MKTSGMTEKVMYSNAQAKATQREKKKTTGSVRISTPIHRTQDPNKAGVQTSSHQGLALGHTQDLRRKIHPECVGGALASHRPNVVVLVLVLVEHKSYHPFPVQSRHSLGGAMTTIFHPSRVQESSLRVCQRPGLGSHARIVQHLCGNIAAQSAVSRLCLSAGGLCRGRILSPLTRSQ